MKKNISVLLFSIFCLVSFAGQKRNGDIQMDAFISNLMTKMTLEEKIGQLNLLTYSEGDIITGEAVNRNVTEKIRKGFIGGIFNVIGVEKVIEIQKLAVKESRLGIPLLFGLDVIHGYKTIFPIPLALSCTWDMEAIEQTARISAIEASADGINWTFSPMVDISRDARWGRIAEGAGEDLFLGGQVAKAMVRGYQGDNTYKSDSHILSCVKHFALYGAPDAGRDYNSVDMSRYRMFNEYMYPYQAAVDAGAASVMASFNEVDGIPATANKWLISDVLRGQWDFKGFVVSDYTGVSEMIVHGIGDLQTVSARALKAGTDMDMVSEGFLTTLQKSLQEKNISEKDINAACRRILEAKYKLGLFSNPYKYCKIERAKTEIFTKEHRDVARKIATESFVLLKNSGKTLPLRKEGTIAVVGPLANNQTNMVGTWSATADLYAAKSVLTGIQEAVGSKANVLYAKGSNLIGDDKSEKRGTLSYLIGRDKRTDEELEKEALEIAEKSDIVVAVLGEAAKMNGEGNCRTDLGIPDIQKRLLKELVKTGRPVVLVLFAGRPMTLAWEDKNVAAILNAWFGGTEAGPAIADILFGNVNPGGKLTTSFPKNVGQIPIHYNYKNTGRPGTSRFDEYRSTYLDVENNPLYPFGYGLSYTDFEYGDVRLDKTSMTGDEKLYASIEVKNTGYYDGSEIVQLYIKDVMGTVTRPVKELKGFEKIFLKAGQSKTVRFEISPDLLKFYNYELKYDWEAGDFEIAIGPNSRDLKKELINWKK